MQLQSFVQDNHLSLSLSLSLSPSVLSALFSLSSLLFSSLQLSFQRIEKTQFIYQDRRVARQDTTLLVSTPPFCSLSLSRVLMQRAASISRAAGFGIDGILSLASSSCGGAGLLFLRRPAAVDFNRVRAEVCQSRCQSRSVSFAPEASKEATRPTISPEALPLSGGCLSRCSPSSLWFRSFAKKKSKNKAKGSKQASTAAADVEKSEIASEDEAFAEEEEIDFDELELEVESVFDGLRIDFASIRPNRATPGMLDHIVVPAYEDKMPLKHLATTNVRDVSTLVVTVFDPQVLQAVEKAILQSPLGLNPVCEGEEIIVRIPTPTAESRQQMCKIVRSQTENRKVQLRKSRQRAMQQAKKVSDKDERRNVEKKVDKFFEDALGKAQDLCSLKEEDIMS